MGRLDRQPGKLYSESIESIDTGPMDAIAATGASYLQVLRYGVVPQVIPPFLSFTIYRWDINVRMSTIIGFVGGGGIGYILKPRVDLGEWGEVGTLVLLIAVTVWLMDLDLGEDPRADRVGTDRGSQLSVRSSPTHPWAGRGICEL